MYTLTDEQCLKFRQLPCSFNDMVRSIYEDGIKKQEYKTNMMTSALQVYLNKGFELKFQDDEWHLFYPSGDSLCCGKTIKLLLEDLIGE
jgi:hypothetical protein